MQATLHLLAGVRLPAGHEAWGMRRAAGWPALTRQQQLPEQLLILPGAPDRAADAALHFLRLRAVVCRGTAQLCKGRVLREGEGSHHASAGHRSTANTTKATRGAAAGDESRRKGAASVLAAVRRT